MKKIIPLTVVGMLVLSGLGAVALPGVEVKKEEMMLSFSRLSVQEEEGYISLELEGADSVFMKKDYYMVPTHIETFTFPFGTEIIDVKCTPENIYRQTITKKLMIAPELVIIGQTPSNEMIQKAENPAVVDIWYEYDAGTGINGNERCVFVKVQVFPVQYYPLENCVDWAENIEIEIQYRVPEQTTLSFDEEYSFVVLTPSEYSGELEDFISHKNSRGISTKLVTLSKIYDGTYFAVQGRDEPEKIKYFIKNACDNWGTKNVLLVGGNEEFPVRLAHVYIYNPHGGWYADFISDLYYADIYDDKGNFSSWDTNENNIFGECDWYEENDELDLYPDVHLGRLACEDSDEVITCVNKIITYETNKAYTKEWFTNLVVIGGDTSPGDPQEVDEGEYINQKIIDVMDGFIPEKCWASNGKIYTREPISNAINKGAGFVDFSGHGTPTEWVNHPHENANRWLPIGGYRNSDVSKLTNEDKLPIVVIDSCSPCGFNIKKCLGWSFVSNPDGGGIGSFGATTNSLGPWGKSAANSCVGRLSINMFKAYKNKGAITFGEMWSRGVTDYLSVWMDNSDYLTVEEWQPFGDPTLAIAEDSHPPVKPDAPEGTTSGSIDVEHNYTVSTTDPNGDKIYYLFDWGDSDFSEWLGPYYSGQTVKASHKWNEKGNYEIRVKAKDDHGVQSEWSYPLSVTMPKNKVSARPVFLQFLERIIDRFPIVERVLTHHLF